MPGNENKALKDSQSFFDKLEKFVNNNSRALGYPNEKINYGSYKGHKEFDRNADGVVDESYKEKLKKKGLPEADIKELVSEAKKEITELRNNLEENTSTTKLQKVFGIIKEDPERQLSYLKDLYSDLKRSFEEENKGKIFNLDQLKEKLDFDNRGKNLDDYFITVGGSTVNFKEIRETYKDNEAGYTKFVNSMLEALKQYESGELKKGVEERKNIPQIKTEDIKATLDEFKNRVDTSNLDGSVDAKKLAYVKPISEGLEVV